LLATHFLATREVRRVPYIAPWGDDASAKRAIWDHLAKPFEPFAAALFEAHVPSDRKWRAMKEGLIGGSRIFSYIGDSK
tara:strand:- start:1117 stop:1353 length:237 start_codon:yes stop_codon:yes gene_type:complete